MEVFELSNWNQHTLIFHFMKRKIFQYNKTRAYIFQVCADSWPYWHKVYLCLFNKEPFLSHMLIHNLKLIPTSQTIKPVSPKGNSVLNIHGKDWWWSWNSNTLATWCEELTYLKRPWCWERLKAGEGNNRGWDRWMASPTQWTWVWINSRSWQWTGKPGMLQSMGSQRVRHKWATELN